MADEVVQALQLTRRFGPRVAVNDVSLAIGRGEIVALLGPNGAGKTTTLRMLAGLIQPSSGRVIVHGQPLTPASADSLRQHIGLLTETPGLWDRLTVRLNLVTYARLYGLARPHDAVERTLSLVGLSDRKRDAAGSLSKGLRQRVAIARALLHDPPIVLLDEPTAGLDPASARQIRDLIQDLGRAGRAVLVSTHNLSEAEQLADRIAILNSSLLALDTPATLRQALGDTRVEIEVEGPAEPWIVRLGVETSPSAAGSTLSLTLADPSRVPDAVSALVQAGARIRRVNPSARTLEEVYLALVGDAEGAA
jgi:ABC-2 type transport system ATP-binding protein